MTMSLRKAAASLLFVVVALGGGVEPPVCAAGEHDQVCHSSLACNQRSEAAISARRPAPRTTFRVCRASRSRDRFRHVAGAPADTRGAGGAALQSLHAMLTV
jgi:hypothetical protein